MPRTKIIDTGLEIVISEEDASKLAKFQVLIDRVSRKINNDEKDLSNYFVSLIYRKIGDKEFDNLNEYASIISTKLDSKAIGLGGISSSKWWMDKPLYIIEICEADEYKYSAMFWSLMVLAVDDTDKEKHLSTICDFARMLDVSDEEMMDLVNVVKYVFQDATYQYPKTKDVADFFSKVLTMYER